MKRAYQIDERKAIDRFRSYLNTNPGDIRLVLPLADLAQRLRHRVSQMLFDAERELLVLIRLAQGYQPNRMTTSRGLRFSVLRR